MVLVHTLLLVFANLPSSQSSCNGQCGFHAIRTGKTNVDGHFLQGHVIRSYNVSNEAECFTACIENDCRCLSFNFQFKKDERTSFHKCTLNKEDRTSDPNGLQPDKDWRYHDIITIIENKDPSCAERICSNSCCEGEPNPCQHNSKCTPLCNTIQRFKCECSIGLSGRFCEKVLYTSCADYFRKNTSLLSGFYLVKENSTKEYNVYCEMDRVNKTAWTLVQSYSYVYNPEFKIISFGENNPIENDAPNFERYRLSNNRMALIKNTSSFWRATCDYKQSEYAAETRDSMIGEFSSVDLFKPMTSEICERIVFLNVRGFQCRNCTTIIKRLSDRTVYIGLKASADDCEFKADLTEASNGEQPFGFYSNERRDFRCTETDKSTTNWWFGEKLA